MKLYLLLATAASLLLPSCSTYPLGHSRNGDYYGGQGMAIPPRNYIPRDQRREREIF